MIAVASSGAALLTAMVGWSSLGLPRPVLTSDLTSISDEIETLKAFSRDSRLLILQNDWWRLHQ